MPKIKGKQQEKNDEYVKVHNGAPIRLRESINESQAYVNRSRRGLSIFEVGKFKDSVKADNQPLFDEGSGLKQELEHYLDLNYENKLLEKFEKNQKYRTELTKLIFNSP